MSNKSDRPTQSDVTSAELLGAVKGFLMESVLPAVVGRDQFNTRVAANVLGIIEREQALSPALQALDREAAQRWLPEQASTEELILINQCCQFLMVHACSHSQQQQHPCLLGVKAAGW